MSDDRREEIETGGKERSSTTFRFATFGPFSVDSDQDLSSNLIANDFWDEIDERQEGLRAAIGIYVFAKQVKKNSPLVPWYVGKTDKGFEWRFRQHKKLFSKLQSGRGKLFLILIARLKPKAHGFMRPRKNALSSHDVLETMLIERCLAANSKLHNASKVRYVKGLVVPGFKNDSGQRNSSARQLRALLHGKTREEL